MLVDHNFINYNDRSHCTHTVDEPGICPHCKKGIRPVFIHGLSYRDVRNSVMQLAATFYCPVCFKPFMVHFDTRSSSILSIAPNIPEQRAFDARIEALSPKFVSIYNQALASEAFNFDEISGMGYRKALEFLIKDYLISLDEDSREMIERMELANCIANKVTNEGLKTVASRSAWLGNDFTHYKRRFDEYDLADLKRFIDAAISWIVLEMTTAEALAIEPHR